MAERYEGGCHCGAVRYAAEGTPINERVCHCRICQKVTGAAFYARLMFPRSAVTIAGPVGRYHSSEGLVRGFCETCGATLFAERASTAIVSLAAGTLDDPAQFRPDMHFWTSSRQPWLKLDDGLPQYSEGPPA